MNLNDEDSKLVRDVVNILSDLRGLDAERMRFILSTVQLAKTFLPKELLPGIESMEMEFNLVLAFIEQAKAYDPTETALSSLPAFLEFERSQS
jgi:hypothetical protein